MFSSNDAIRIRMKLSVLLLIPVAVGIGVKLYFVQVKRHDELLQKARNQYTTTKKVSGKRGEIFDINGNLLVSNEPCMDINCDPAIIAGVDTPRAEKEKVTPEKLRREKIRAEHNRVKTAYFLASQLGMDYNEIYRKLAPYRQRRDKDLKPVFNPDGTPHLELNRFVPIASKVPYHKGREIKRLARINKLNSLFFADTYARSYPKGKLLSNVIGFIRSGRDSEVPVLGIERELDGEMTAVTGEHVYERGRDGRVLDYGRQSEQHERDGYNIYLTIDEVVQSILEEELDAAFEKWKPKALYAVIADPNTGNILAIAQRPAFDPNGKLRPEDLRTRISSDALEPGSIIKPFCIARAIDRKLVNENTVIDCENGRWMFMGRPLTDSHPYGKLTVSEVIQKSSNIGSAKIAMMMDKKEVYETLRGFGFGERTGLPLRPETRGRLAKPETWSSLSISRIPIGYEVQVSPVQMVRAYCALADGGRLRKLRLIDHFEDPETGEIIRRDDGDVKQMFQDPQTVKTIVSMMTRVTKPGGTATQAAVKGFEVAGKTGTSRKYVPHVGYVRGKYFGSFVGFVPAEDPKIVMLVTMDEPQGRFYGGTVSAPVFSAVAEKVLKYYNISPTVPEELSPAGKDGQSPGAVR